MTDYWHGDGWPRVRFVSRPDLNAEVRFDFNVDADDADEGPLVYVDEDGWDIGRPQLEGEPDSVGVKLGLRQITINAVVEGTARETLEIQSRLAREVLRHRNWLMLQVGPDVAPVWFHTYRSQPGKLVFTDVRVDVPDEPDLWRIEMVLDADPYAAGERRTLPPMRVDNDPSSVSGCRVVLAGLVGDGPAPLRVEVRPLGAVQAGAGGADGMAGSRWMVGTVARHPEPAGDVSPGGGLVLDAGADTAAALAPSGSAEQVTGATWSGGVAVSWPVLDPTVLAARAVTAPVAVFAGAYRALVRVGRVDGSSTCAVRLDHQTAGSTRVARSREVLMDRATGPAGHVTWLDLGVLSIPSAEVVVADDVDLGSVSTIFTLRGRRTGGTGRLVFDSVLLVPVDGPDVVAASTLYTTFDAAGPVDADGAWTVWDAAAEACWQNRGHGLVDAAGDGHAGGFPHGQPGAETTLWVLQQAGGAKPAFTAPDSADRIVAVTEVVVSYQPQWLWIGDGGAADR